MNINLYQFRSAENEMKVQTQVYLQMDFWFIFYGADAPHETDRCHTCDFRRLNTICECVLLNSHVKKYQFRSAENETDRC